MNSREKGTDLFFVEPCRRACRGAKNRSVPFCGARCRGFSLLEVLVAFTILATVLGVLFQIFSSGLNRARLADEYSRAVVLAESELARLGVERSVTEGTRRGRIDDVYRWRTTVQPYAYPEEETPPAPGLRPYVVTVEIRWGEGDEEHAVPLTTIRLLEEG